MNLRGAAAWKRYMVWYVKESVRRCHLSAPCLVQPHEQQNTSIDYQPSHHQYSKDNIYPNDSANHYCNSHKPGLRSNLLWSHVRNHVHRDNFSTKQRRITDTFRPSLITAKSDQSPVTTHQIIIIQPSIRSSKPEGCVAQYLPKYHCQSLAASPFHCNKNRESQAAVRWDEIRLGRWGHEIRQMNTHRLDYRIEVSGENKAAWLHRVVPCWFMAKIYRWYRWGEWFRSMLSAIGCHGPATSRLRERCCDRACTVRFGPPRLISYYSANTWYSQICGDDNGKYPGIPSSWRKSMLLLYLLEIVRQTERAWDEGCEVRTRLPGPLVWCLANTWRSKPETPCFGLIYLVFLICLGPHIKQQTVASDGLRGGTETERAWNKGDKARTRLLGLII